MSSASCICAFVYRGSGRKVHGQANDTPIGSMEAFEVPVPTHARMPGLFVLRGWSRKACWVRSGARACGPIWLLFLFFLFPRASGLPLCACVHMGVVRLVPPQLPSVHACFFAPLRALSVHARFVRAFRARACAARLNYRVVAPNTKRVRLRSRGIELRRAACEAQASACG